MRKQNDIRQYTLTNNKTKDGKDTLEPYTFDLIVVRRKLAEMIILHEYPLRMVEHNGFKEYSATLQPLFKPVSRNTIKRHIMQIYDVEKEKTISVLEANRSRISITTGMWTSSHQKKGFMAVTVHFIDDSWAMQSRILRFIYVPCPHTAETLCEALNDCLMDWNIDRKLSSITVDNCSTNKQMIPSLLEKLNNSDLILNGTLFHMRCCAHILNLIVKDGLDVIGEGIERIRSSVLYWVATPKRIEKFEDTARQLNIPYSKRLVLDCPTRWNSTYFMLTIALLYKDVFARLSVREKQYKIEILGTDWRLAAILQDNLKLFYEVTEMFSGTKYPTTNVFFLHVCDIRLSLSD
ncbi:hypothetical protein EZV62_001607 [Acer yangbiense]|uniref:hAT-like transposase RNase-H fold domain-containing protein n=1 Tax=Acer yangbiense TaxID=1000413 RepID=A0A5C7IVC5_9ROSI|nr:hypothetical protein EZV62_001607 [Acer yangbiense]